MYADRRVLVALGAISAFAVPWMLYLGAHRVDDAYIVYRYAENIAALDGVAFNPGEPVEGVTSMLWLALLVPFAAVGLPLDHVAPWLSQLCALALLWALPGLCARARRRSEADVVDCLPSLLLALVASFAYWARGALETPLFALLLVLGLRAHLAERAREVERVPSWLWYGLAVWTRPEAPLYALAVMADRATGRRRQTTRQVLQWGVRVGAFLALLLVFRLLYFDEYLPNTYFAKSGAPVEENFRVGFLYSLQSLAALVPGTGSRELAQLVSSAPLVILVAWGMLERGLLALGLTAILIFMSVIFNGGDWMPLGRFWLPGLAVLFVLGATMMRKLGRRRRAAQWVNLAIFAMLSLGHIVQSVSMRIDPEGELHPSRGRPEVYEEVAAFLSEYSEPDDLVALMDIGLIGYRTGLRVLDISGLVEPFIAKSPGPFLRKRYPVSYLLDREPDFFVLRPRYFSVDQRILRDPDFRSRYVRVFERAYDIPRRGWLDGRMVVFARRGSAAASRAQ